MRHSRRRRHLPPRPFRIRFRWRLNLTSGYLAAAALISQSLHTTRNIAFAWWYAGQSQCGRLLHWFERQPQNLTTRLRYWCALDWRYFDPVGVLLADATAAVPVWSECI